tara:strand:- start:4359 stop:4835 length:477 start_codon:yes stop_codon:yes gene_type:complete
MKGIIFSFVVIMVLVASAPFIIDYTPQMGEQQKLTESFIPVSGGFTQLNQSDMSVEYGKTPRVYTNYTSGINSVVASQGIDFDWYSNGTIFTHATGGDNPLLNSASADFGITYSYGAQNPVNDMTKTVLNASFSSLGIGIMFGALVALIAIMFKGKVL